MTTLQNITTLIRHNPNITAAAITVLFITVNITGCQSTTKSLLNPNTQVTRDELQLELDTLTAQAAQRKSDLDRQDLFKHTLLEIGRITTEGGHLNPTGILTTLASILGLGAAIDNRRKDTIIKTLTKQPQQPTTPQTP